MIDRLVYYLRMTKRDTKSILLDHGIQLMLEHGYHDTGIQDVLTAAKVPKGSFYHHFRNKEDFGLQVVQRYADAAYRSLDEHLSDERYAPIDRVRRFFADVIVVWDHRSCHEGCLLGKLGQELADVNERFRRCIAATLDEWAARIAICLTEAQRCGEIPADGDPRKLADLLLDGFEGAALRMKLVKNIAPLEGFVDLYFDHVLST